MERIAQNYHFNEDKRLLAKMKEEFFDCPAAVKYIRSLNIPDNVIEQEIVKIYDLVCDIKICRNCPGVDNCSKDTPRLCTKIIYEDGVVSRVLVPCKEYLKLVKFKSQFVVRDFEEEWLFSTKKMDRTPKREEVVKKYANYLDGNSKEWIYIIGESGTGRTYVAANIAIDLAKNEKGPIAFINAPIRFKELRNTKDNEKFDEIIDKYSSIPVLIVDDFGNEYKNEFVRENILFPIINNRARKHLFTIFTSDFNINDITTMYVTNEASKPKVKQIKRILKNCCGKEINLGEMSIY